jgi:hypothetical protein
MVNIQSSKQIVSGGNSIGTEQEMATFFSKGTNSKYFWLQSHIWNFFGSTEGLNSGSCAGQEGTQSF